MKSSKFILILTSAVLLNKTINGEVLLTQNDNKKTDDVEKLNNDDDNKAINSDSQQEIPALNSQDGKIQQVSTIKNEPWNKEGYH